MKEKEIVIRPQYEYKSLVEINQETEDKFVKLIQSEA